MKVVYLSVIVAGCTVVGLLVGSWFAAMTDAAAGSGLAGGAIVLGYGVVGAVLAALVGLVAGLRLTARRLQRGAAAAALGLVAFGVYVSLWFRSERLSHLDPPEAYAGIPPYTLRLERTQRADPVLAKQVLIDSRGRTWAVELPDGRTCSAPASAESLRTAAEALETFLNTTRGSLACTGEIDQVIHWQSDAGAEPAAGRAELTAPCLLAAPDAGHVVFTVQQLTLQSDAPVRCE